MKTRRIIWASGAHGSFRYSIQVEKPCESLEEYEKTLKQDGWTTTSEFMGDDGLDGFISSKEFDSKEALDKWAKDFPYPVLFENANGREFLLNFKKKQGRAKK